MTFSQAATSNLRPQRPSLLVFHALSMLCFSTAGWSQTRPAAEVFGENRQALTVPGIQRMEGWVFSTYQESNPAYDDPDMEEIAFDEAQLGAIGQLPMARVDPADLAALKDLGRDLTMFIIEHAGPTGVGMQLEVNGLVSIESLRIGDDVRSVVAAPASNFGPIIGLRAFLSANKLALDLPRGDPLIWYELCPQGDLQSAWLQVRKYILRTWGSGLEASIKGEHLSGFTPGWLRYGPHITTSIIQDAEKSLLFELAAQRPHDRQVLDALIQRLDSAAYPRLATKLRESLPAPSTGHDNLNNAEARPGSQPNLGQRILEERKELEAKGLVLDSDLVTVVVGTQGRLPFMLGDSGSVPEELTWLLQGSVPSQPITAASLLDRQLGSQSSAPVAAELARILNDLGAPATAYTLAHQALLREPNSTDAGKITHRAIQEALRSLFALKQKPAAYQLVRQARTRQGMPVDISPLLADLIAWAEGS